MMGEWKYKIGDVLKMGESNIFAITGTREDQCSAGAQRFYLGHHILKSFTLGVGVTNPVSVIPDIVFEEMVKMAKEKKENGIAY